MNLTITPKINTYSNQPKETTFGCPPRYLVASKLAHEQGVNPSKLRESLKSIAKRRSSKPKIAKSETPQVNTQSTMSIEDIAKEQLGIAIRNGLGK